MWFKNPIKKCVSDLNTGFSKKEFKMAEKQKCSTSVSIKEMQIKTSLRFHLIPDRMAHTNNKKVTAHACKDVK